MLPPYDPFVDISDFTLAEEVIGMLGALQARLNARDPEWFTLGDRIDLDRAVEMGYELLDRLNRREEQAAA